MYGEFLICTEEKFLSKYSRKIIDNGFPIINQCICGDCSLDFDFFSRIADFLSR